MPLIDGLGVTGFRSFYSDEPQRIGPLEKITLLAGHNNSAAVTLGVYAHLWPGDDDRARGIFDAALADCARTEEVVG
jgi:hypothetical protein